MSKRSFTRLATAGAVAAGLLGGAGSAQALTFTNSGNIKIPNTGTAGNGGPYPSNITVSGATTNPNNVAVTLHGFSHTFPDDVDVALVGPTGLRLLLMTDAGGSTGVSNRTLTFDRAATAQLPDGGTIFSGTWLPSVYGTFGGSLPAGPNASGLGSFNGLNPNGTWKLYVYDDVGGDIGSIANGWSLEIVRDLINPTASYSGPSSRTVSRSDGASDVDSSPVILSGTAYDNRGVTQVLVRVRAVGDSGFDEIYVASCPSCGPTSTPVSWALSLSTLSPAPPAGQYTTEIIPVDGVNRRQGYAGPNLTFQP